MLKACESRKVRVLQGSCVCAIHSNVLISPTDYDTSWTGGAGEGVHMSLNTEKKL